MWLPVRRSREPRLTYSGLYTSLHRRALAADPPFALGGWSDISMVQRYIRAAENELAIG